MDNVSQRGGQLEIEQSPTRDLVMVVGAGVAENTLARSFEALGREALRLETARAVIDAIQQRRPSIVVLEWSLPDASGLDLLTELKRVSPTTLSVVVTAHASIPAALAAIRAGAADYMTKPASAIEILNALGALDLVDRQIEPAADHSLTLQQARREYIRDVLDECRSIAKTARVLHLDRTSLRRMLSRFDLPSKPVSVRPVGTVRAATHLGAAVRELPLSLAASDG